tara:strand:+ start:30879 stop:31103 length:225 start_codon:yes stop_codon:yes gene_type:complete
MSSKKTITGGGTHQDGVVVGESASEKVGFHGAEPSDQAAAIDDITPAADGTTAGTAVNNILAVLREKGLIAPSS